MPNILENFETESISDAFTEVVSDAEAQEAMARLQVPVELPDLSNRTQIGDITISPMQDGIPQSKGRANAIRAWMWNGSESLLPLGWDPSGKIHDGARKYWLKRHCLCCHTGGFQGTQCPNCVKSRCPGCNGSTVKGKIIPNFYIRKEDVPFPDRFYGEVNCFLPYCPRRGSMGFTNNQEMRMHAETIHTLEYKAHLDELAANKADELDLLRGQVAALMTERRTYSPDPVAKPKKPRSAKQLAGDKRRSEALKAKLNPTIH
jgi:hypothetical protein